MVFASGLSGPSGLAISPQGDIYVASYNEDLVWRFMSNGNKTVFVRGLATPAGLSFDSRARLLIANCRTNQILATHPNGEIEVVVEGLLTLVGAVELLNGGLLVSNIAGEDAVYVVDYGGTTVRRVNRQGIRTVIPDQGWYPKALSRLEHEGLTLWSEWRETRAGVQYLVFYISPVPFLFLWLYK
ncbi:hypothetical protein [Yersinia frederiksenii]|uniref:hypothetical protein n=1 Tax=Yersinia frederiksenii TaxID=29484 RepID=UPI0005E6B728|nr:hypothetical protein [Yersinia frederiksenii]CNE93177.1 NHL repeat [Yersinia frederiksenii]